MTLPLTAANVYHGSDGAQARTFYAELNKRGPIGAIAVNLFRAQKCSARAKVYRGGIRGQGSYRSMAYERKSWSMANLCVALGQHAEALRINYGWKEDPLTPLHGGASWVLYVDLPTGQASFHSPNRGQGPDYSGDWDGQHKSAERIIEFCCRVLDGELSA